MFYFVNFEGKLSWNVVCNDSERACEQKNDICEVVFHSTRLWPLFSGNFTKIFPKYLHALIQIEGGINDFETLKLSAKHKIQIVRVPVKKVAVYYGGVLYVDL